MFISIHSDIFQQENNIDMTIQEVFLKKIYDLRQPYSFAYVCLFGCWGEKAIRFRTKLEWLSCSELPHQIYFPWEWHVWNANQILINVHLKGIVRKPKVNTVGRGGQILPQNSLFHTYLEHRNIYKFTKFTQIIRVFGCLPSIDV